MKKRSLTILLILIGAAGLLYPVFINGYPLVYSDSGTYIVSGYQHLVPNDRPVMYGLLIRHIGLGTGLTVFVCVQAFLVSLSIYMACKLLTKDTAKNAYLSYTVSMFLVICCTTLPWVTSWMMPDIFSGVSALLLVVLLFAEQSVPRNKWIVLLYIILTLTHLSNILSHVFALGVVSLLFVVQRMVQGNTTISVKRLFTIGLVVLSNYGVMVMVNYGFTKKIFVSKGGDIFLTAKLCDEGLVNAYLNSHCPAETQRLCELKDSIRPQLGHFLWDGNSVLYKMGGWNDPSAEFGMLNKAILTKPEFLKVFVQKGLEGSVNQFLSFDAGQDFLNYGDTLSPPFVAVNWFLKNEVTSYLQSKQNTGALLFPFQALNWIQWYLIIGLLIVAAISLMVKIHTTSKWTFITTGILLMTNAIVCAFLTSVGGRYQSRMVWIVVVVFVIEAINNRNYFVKLFSAPKS